MIQGEPGERPGRKPSEPSSPASPAEEPERGTITIGSDSRHRAEHQGENEFDKLVELHGLELTSYRHADSATKNFTVTISKHSNAQLQLDNTASARNTFVYMGGASAVASVDGALFVVEDDQGIYRVTGGRASLWAGRDGAASSAVHLGGPGRLAPGARERPRAPHEDVTLPLALPPSARTFSRKVVSTRRGRSSKRRRCARSRSRSSVPPWTRST